MEAADQLLGFQEGLEAGFWYESFSFEGLEKSYPNLSVEPQPLVIYNFGQWRIEAADKSLKVPAVLCLGEATPNQPRPMMPVDHVFTTEDLDSLADNEDIEGIYAAVLIPDEVVRCEGFATCHAPEKQPGKSIECA